jgi:hypothetical protein
MGTISCKCNEPVEKDKEMIPDYSIKNDKLSKIYSLIKVDYLVENLELKKELMQMKYVQKLVKKLK